MENDERSEIIDNSNVVDGNNKNKVGDIMELVKAGKISKSEALNELRQRLQQTSIKKNIDISNLTKNIEDNPVIDSKPVIDNNRNVIDDDFDKLSNISGSSRISRFTKEDRRNIISKLIEKKRLGINQDTNPEYDGNDDQENNQNNIERSDSSILASDPLSNSNANYDNWSPDYHHLNGNNDQYDYSSPQLYKPRKSFDDSINRSSLGRSSRLLQSEAAIREEMFKECTFHPIIKPLPDHYVSTKDLSTPFLQRVQKWNKDKSVTIEKKRKDIERIKSQDCSFHPVINRHSYKAMVEVRGRTNQESANDRLYRSAISSTTQKLKFTEDYMKVADEIYQQQCTFQPQLVTKGRFEYVNPKYNNIIEKNNQNEHIRNLELKECTFTPKVKGIKPNMNSAKLYLSTNVIDRLTRPITATNDHVESFDDNTKAYDVSYNDRNVMNVASFMNTMHGNEKRRSSSAPRERRKSDLVINDKQFQNFLLRQKSISDFIAKKIEDKKQKLTPSFHPELCSKSITLSETTTRGEFLERVERDVSQRKDKLIKSQNNIINNLNLTFQPKINEKSLKLRRRTSQEMSRGDLLKKELHNRINREKFETEKSLDVTFIPEISSKGKQTGKSIIKVITEDSTTFKDWYKEKQLKLEEKRKQIENEKLENEMKDCTFVPKTKDCPAYVKRIAKSMAIIKASKGNDVNNNSLKPDWK